VTWSLRQVDLKRYPHFDTEIAADKAEALVKDPDLVARHSFYPFIFFNQSWNKWAPRGQKGKIKERPIRYAARRDAYIFSYYRSILSELYEEKLKEKGLSECALAYRKIISPDGRGQCNIDFAKRAFDEISRHESCVVAALDISGFFDNVRHDKIKQDWSNLIGLPRLPRDHFSVFKAITKYSYIDRNVLYEALGLIGMKQLPSGRFKKGYLVPHRDMPKRQICSPKQLRNIISQNPAMLQVNRNEYGVPQGAPISDLLANIYMLEFDEYMLAWTSKRSGLYMRYSDDIIVIIPGRPTADASPDDIAHCAIQKYAPGLTIKRHKTHKYLFSRSNNGAHTFERLLGPENQGANGLEYLGFRFDGKNVFIRDTTLSNLWRKVSKSANRHAVQHVKRYRDKSLEDLEALLNIDGFVKNFGRVEQFNEKKGDVQEWTFWTYVKRCEAIFGDNCLSIRRQLRSHREIIATKLIEALRYYHGRL
jgi:hypothetical protein